MLRSLTSQLPTARTSFVRLHSTGSKPRTTRFLNDFMTEAEKGPLQLSMESKLTEALNPTAFEAINESHLHSHHAAMKGVTEKETHFRSMMQRHRMIYKLLGEEFGQGLHALSLKTKTMAELEKSK
ncbi:bola protein [Phycomyces blakesleeanus]|uniref:Bola protein n=1 Tax=Phycomyces blakesleeanus TaxID=4837 RepID=A0ABR3ALD0_PHYBL